MRFFKNNFGLFVVLILSLWSIQPFFASGFFPIHDNTQVARVFEMNKVLKIGVFPVRVVPDLGYGYGYPLFNFYAPLAYYVGAIFMFLGLDALIATKIMMVLGIILAGIFMYYLVREFFGEYGGIISGLFYAYVPYHAVDIYVRGDIAEFWAYAFIPLAFLGFYKRNILLGTIGFAGIILSHNLTAMMVMPFLLAAILIDFYVAPKNRRIFIMGRSLFIVFFSLMISAFYWIPALTEMKNTNVFSQIRGGADFRDNFACIGQLWDSLWGFGGSVAGCVDGLSFKVGKLHVLTAITAFIIMLFLKKIRKSSQGLIILFIFSGFVVSIFLMLEISKFVWEAIPAMAFFQYPWRFLIITSFSSSFLAGSLIYLLKQFKIKSYLTMSLLVFLLLFFNIKLFVPQTILSKTANDFTNEYILKWTVSKISDEFLSNGFKKPIRDKDVNEGQMEIKVQETNIEKASNAVSLVGLLGLIPGIILFKEKKHE
jgi:hypothetical protein